MVVNTYPKILLTGTQAEYNAIESKDANKLYWTSDTHKIYKGSVDYSEFIKVVTGLPSTVATRAIGKLYLDSTTGQVAFYDGTDWNVVSYPAATSFLDSSDELSVDDLHVPTTEAVAEYIEYVIGGSSDVVASITAGNTAGSIVYTTGDDQEHVVTVPSVMASITAGTADGKVAVTMTSGSHDEITVPGVFTSVSWDSTTRVLTFTDSDGVNTGDDHVVNLGKDIFIDSSANNRYQNGNIYLYLNDGSTSTTATEIVIPVTGLITDYVGGDTNSITLTVDNQTHIVTADAVLRQNVAESSVGADDGFTNALKLSSSTAATGGVGLYVDLHDVEANIDGLGEAIQWGSFA